MADAEKPEQDDQAERHAKEPQQDENHGCPPFYSWRLRMHGLYQAT
jgi:hypothetical protein